MTAFKSHDPRDAFTKVPEVTLVFWIIKIAATTLGETGGDSVTMTLNWGYLTGTAIFLAALIVLVVAQVLARRFHPFLYWATIVASTTFGTTMADFADRSLGIGYTGGSSLLLALLLATLALWYVVEGSISVETVSRPRVEAFYWAAITFSQTLGTALGDWMADTTGLGYEGGALAGAATATVGPAEVFISIWGFPRGLCAAVMADMMRRPEPERNRQSGAPTRPKTGRIAGYSPPAFRAQAGISSRLR